MSERTKKCWKNSGYRLKNSGEARRGLNHPGFGKRIKAESIEKMRIAAFKREATRRIRREVEACLFES